MTATTITVRDGTADDAAGIARVHVDGWRTRYVGLVPQRLLDADLRRERPQQVLLAEHAAVVAQHRDLADGLAVAVVDEHGRRRLRVRDLSVRLSSLALMALALAVVEPTWTDFHVSYRVGARHALTQGAAGKAIALLDVDEPAYAVTSGELQSGARGLAAPVLGVEGLHASVGVVTLDGAIDEDVVAPQVLAAAHEVAERLR